MNEPVIIERLYVRVAEQIIRTCLSSSVRVNMQLPSISALSSNLGSSRATVRLALRYLSKKHVIRADHGRGIFLASLDAAKDELRVAADRLYRQALADYTLLECRPTAPEALP